MDKHLLEENKLEANVFRLLLVVLVVRVWLTFKLTFSKLWTCNESAKLQYFCLINCGSNASFWKSFRQRQSSLCGYEPKSLAIIFIHHLPLAPCHPQIISTTCFYTRGWRAQGLSTTSIRYVSKEQFFPSRKNLENKRNINVMLLYLDHLHGSSFLKMMWKTPTWKLGKPQMRSDTLVAFVLHESDVTQWCSSSLS